MKIQAGPMAVKKIQDYRALYGALSLLLVGLILSFQFIFYLRDDDFSKEIIRARWLWEIVLNGQILCLAFMWFSHHNRILFSHGRWRVRAILNFVAGFVAVGTPGAIMFVAALFDWYRDPPDPGMPKFMLVIAMSSWLAVRFSTQAIHKYSRLRRAQQSQSNAQVDIPAKHDFLYRNWPAILAAVFLASNELFSNDIGLVFATFLCFLQGAMTYYLKAKKPPYYETEAYDAG